jgi:quinohemoprotein amine dehydrogenase
LRKFLVGLVAPCALGLATVVLAQGVSEDSSSRLQGNGPQQETEEGIPVTDALTISKCTACHIQDSKGDLSRISWIRTTPEGWSQAIKRMVRQNGLQISPSEAHSVIKYLASDHGLAPEEAKPVMYMTEQRIQDETLIPNEAVRGACASCHAFGVPMQWRRSKADWKLLQNLHVALYSQAEVMYRRPASSAGTEGPADPNDRGPTQADVALDFLSKNAPLHTPQWEAWRARMRTPQLDGKWLVSASVPGKGRFVGEMTVEPGPAKDEFKTSVLLTSLKDGSILKRTGTSLVYGGYAWRGRSHGTPGAKLDDLNSDAREALWIAPNQSSAEGRWYWGEYQEFGFDVKVMRAGGPAVIAVAPYALKAGSSGLPVKIYGSSLPTSLAAGDVRLGSGVTVTKVVSATPSEVDVEVDVAADATSGPRDAEVKGAVLERAVPVFHKVDYIKVTPETALARLGSDVHPKGYQQFEAIGYENGSDGKPNTADDVALGPIDVDWKVEEFMAVYNDDDKDFVGKLGPTALFTPASDGPNPKRKFSRNNYGDVWVVATARTERDRFGKPLSGRAYLVVTVPSYQRWDQPEVSQ